MKTWVKVGTAAAAVVVVGGGLAVWSLGGDGEGTGEISAHLLEVSSASSDIFGPPLWWTDGSSLARFSTSGNQDQLLTYAPLNSRWGVDLPDPRRQLAGGDEIVPRALAVQPGRSSTVWAAVGTREIENDAARQPVMVWTADGQDGPDRPSVEAQELPVDVEPVTSADNTFFVRAAATTVEEQAVIVVAVEQADQRELVRCSLVEGEPCAWERAKGPVDGASVQLAATADGMIAVAQLGDERPTIWTADDVDLSWEQVGSAPRGMQVVDLVDGDPAATLVWRGGGDVVIQSLSALGGSAPQTEVPSTAVPGDPGFSLTAVEVDDQWYLGGEVPGDPNVELAFSPSTPALWTLDGDRWKRVSDALLTHQVDQRFVALLATKNGDLGAVTSSPVLDLDQLWRFESDRPGD